MKRSMLDVELPDNTIGACKRIRVCDDKLCSGAGAISAASKSNRCRHSLACRSHRCANGKANSFPESLTQLAAKVAAASTPFQMVEVRYPRIPEPVVLQFVKWSFPRSEADIRRYSALSCAACEQIAYKHAPPNDSTRTSSPGSSSSSHTDSHHAGNDGKETGTDAESDVQELSYSVGCTLAESGAVRHPMQIGFHLSGQVEEAVSSSSSCHSLSNLPQAKKVCYNVAVTFDRCKVTSSTCDCANGDAIFFCRHVVALLLFRIRYPEKVKLRCPISDTLQQLSRDQLQKLAQYVLARHPSVLPTAQEIADDFEDTQSSLNVFHGAPDPTAGAGFQDEDRWCLDDQQVTEYVRRLMLQPNKLSCPNELYSMLGKVREMMKVRDCNGARLLTLITTEVLRQGAQLSSQQHCSVVARIWDHISLLWVCVVLNPRSNGEQRQTVLQQLRTWNCDPHCPLEETFSDGQTGARREVRRSVLSRAVEAGALNWEDPHLRLILIGRESGGKSSFSRSDFGGAGATERERRSAGASGGLANFSSDGKPLWHEHTPMACARVEALRSHGYAKEAIRLARSIARTIREKAVGSFKLYQEAHQQQVADPVPPKRNTGFGLVGDPLNPIHILYDALTSSEANSYASARKIPGSLKRDAFEVCLLAIGEQRCMPTNARAQEKVLQCEKLLIDQLKKLRLDKDQVAVLRDVAALLIEGGPASGLGKRVHRESVPMHSFATYLFKALLPHDRDLAFRVGLQAMRMPILEDPTASADNANNGGSAARRSTGRGGGGGAHPERSADPEVRPPVVGLAQEEPGAANQYAPPFFPEMSFIYRTSWSVMRDLEYRQYTLASELLQTAKGEVMTLRVVVESVQRHIRNGSHVFQLSHDAFKCATLQQGAATADSTLLNVAMELAMQVLKMTLRSGMNGRRRTEMVGWLVTCATEIGLCALLSIIKAWYTLFSPMEACTMVAGCVISPNTAVRLSLSPAQRDEVVQCVCQMAVQCAVKDPQSCALCSLTLCESISSAFDAVYHVIIESANKRRVDSTQLFTIARYLDQRGYHARAFAVAHGATKRLRVPFNHEAHPAGNDLLWTTQLAQSLGMKELEDLINVIVSKVTCASVLSDVLRSCTSTISGRLPSVTGSYGNRGLRADRAPLRPLLEASVSAYISTIHNKLSHISPRHYAEFIEFLNKAKETFFLAPDGHAQFSRLLTDLKTTYKGKKKLLVLVGNRFREFA